MDDECYWWLPDGTGLTDDEYMGRRSMFYPLQRVRTTVTLSDATGTMECGTVGTVVDVEEQGVKVKFAWDGRFVNTTKYMTFVEVEPLGVSW